MGTPEAVVIKEALTEPKKGEAYSANKGPITFL